MSPRPEVAPAAPVGDGAWGLAHSAEDLRGMTVVDRHLHRVGEVDGLIVDEQEHRTPLLLVGSGGILGLARTQRLVPVDAVTRVDHLVHIAPSHEQVHQCPEYVCRPGQPSNLDEVYRHYGWHGSEQEDGEGRRAGSGTRTQRAS